VGEWETEGEIFIEGQPSIKTKGTETVRRVGGFWVVTDITGEFMGAPFVAVMTLGYDAEKKKYVGTWVDSAQAMMWHYSGTVDDGGKILSLETRGPNPVRPGEIADFRDTMEIKNSDEREFTSSIVEKDGTLTKMMTVKYRRKK
jgi:hypothetical protein